MVKVTSVVAQSKADERGKTEEREKHTCKHTPIVHHRRLSGRAEKIVLLSRSGEPPMRLAAAALLLASSIAILRGLLLPSPCLDCGNEKQARRLSTVFLEHTARRPTSASVWFVRHRVSTAQPSCGVASSLQLFEIEIGAVPVNVACMVGQQPPTSPPALLCGNNLPAYSYFTSPPFSL